MRKLSKANSEYRLLNVEVQQAIARTTNSKALGPDQLAPLMLKKLGPLAVACITKMFNCSLAKATITSIWKKSRVIPLLKAGKPRKSQKLPASLTTVANDQADGNGTTSDSNGWRCLSRTSAWFQKKKIDDLSSL